jgi:hypothetical protein
VTNTLIDSRVSESWGGLTWSRPVGALGLGATLYGAYRSQRGREEWLSQPVPTGSPGSVLTSVNDHNYWHFRLLAKAGLYWEHDSAGLGITITTPGLPLFGGGQAAFYRSVVPADSTTSVPTITESVVVSDPSVKYRSPMSIALGSRYQAGRNAVYATLEWFDSVDRYRVLETSAVPDSGLGSALGAKLTQELKAVFNVSVGYEYSPRENITLYGSFLTDFSAAVDDPSASHSFSTWDIYQVTTGAAFTAVRVDFTLGVSFAGGSEPMVRQNDLPVSPFAESVEARYRRIKAFIGFEFRS